MLRQVAPASFVMFCAGAVAATRLELGLRPDQERRSRTVRALANEVVIGLMAATLDR